MSNKIIKNKTEKSKTTRRSVWVCSAVISIVILLLFTIKTIKSNEPQSVAYPEATKFSYNAETGEVEAEDIGEDFIWEGYWPADDTVMSNMEIIKELSEE